MTRSTSSTPQSKQVEREQRQMAREAEQRRKEAERREKEVEKQKAADYLAKRQAETESENAKVEKRVSDIENLLQHQLANYTRVSVDTFKMTFQRLVFDERDRSLDVEKPRFDMPQKPTGLLAVVPGTMRRYEKSVAEKEAAYKVELSKYDEKVKLLHNDYLFHLKRHEEQVSARKAEIDKHNVRIDDLFASYGAGERDGVAGFIDLVLSKISMPEGFPRVWKTAYEPESRQLIVQYDYPPYDIVPDLVAFTYIKSKDEIKSKSRTATEKRKLYASLVAQISLAILHAIFITDTDNHSKIDVIVFNGHVHSIDRATGRKIYPCLISVRTTKDTFTSLDLEHVEPDKCLKYLSASVSSAPDELAPVKPVLEFSMVDPRFVEEQDVLTDLDTRPNLMELTPGEFESLITNLFQKMGLETKLTQASRDGGVDCVAYDPRPIFGGKVVIQAKRYKNTVGVSAVRDLYGTLQNEGASKGILVTTSGYGKAAFEFAEGKPIELLAGSNLLYLLEEHAGIKAKIVVPDAWKDPVPDVN
jgi:restriction system protein